MRGVGRRAARRRLFAGRLRFKIARRPRRSKELSRYADEIRIPDVQGRSGAILRPNGISYDIDDEFDAHGAELVSREKASGIRASRAAESRAARYASLATDARDLTARTLPEYEAATAAFTTAQNDLGPFVRRRPKDGTRYKLTRWGLLGADTGAVLGALIYVGEVPLLAVGTAFAVGLSAVTAGMLGSDTRELRLARDRRSLVDAELIDPAVVARYPRLFARPSKDRDTYGLAMMWGLGITLSVALGVFALRAAIEGLLGVVFAGFALATTLASFLSAWAHGDDVADLLEVYGERMRTAKGEYRGHVAAPEPALQAEWSARADSVLAEHDAIAASKSDSVRGLRYAVYRNNRHVFGDGATTHRLLRPPQIDGNESDRQLTYQTTNHVQHNGEPHRRADR